MNNSNKISVIMSIYNGEKYLKEAVDSILSQTFEDFEFIIVNDASTDATFEILSQLEDPRIEIINNMENKGLTYNLNVMLSMCRGKYIARMDADDIALPHRFQVQYDYMESHPETGVCGSWIETFFEKTGKKQTVRYATDDTGIRAFAFFQAPFCHPTVMMRKEVLESNQLQYPIQYRLGQDYALWVELLKLTKGANLPEVLLRFRRHEENVSNKNKGKEYKTVEMLTSIQQRYLLQYDILFDNHQEVVAYTQFVDRSVPSDLSFAAQKEVSIILDRVFKQIEQRHSHLQVLWIYYLSLICFYNFFVEKKIPVTFFLQKLYCKGACDYLKKFVLSH
jgi:glycosyltransferase involved in cell wall biosynthesis